MGPGAGWVVGSVRKHSPHEYEPGPVYRVMVRSTTSGRIEIEEALLTYPQAQDLHEWAQDQVAQGNTFGDLVYWIERMPG